MRRGYSGNRFCVDGENAAPPEDVGGVHGFREFREFIADPDYPEYKSYRQWAGCRYDPGLGEEG